MEFYNFNNQLQRPFAVYADFKCSRITADEPGILQKHEPNSAAVRFVNTFGPSINQTWSYVGKDCVSNLITELNKLAQECIIEMQKHTKYENHMKRTNSIKKEAICCYLCHIFLQSKNTRSRTIATEPENTVGQLTTCVTSTSSATGICWYSSTI